MQLLCLRALVSAAIPSLPARPCRTIEFSSVLSRIIQVDPIAVSTGLDIVHPVLIREIPLDGFSNACLKCFGRLPVQFALNLGGINCITAIVAGSVRNKGNLFSIRFAVL